MFSILGPISSQSNPVKKPVVGRVSCGFPSPALEYSEPPLSIDELVSLREPSRWLLRADGDSLRDIGNQSKPSRAHEVLARGLRLLMGFVKR